MGKVLQSTVSVQAHQEESEELKTDQQEQLAEVRSNLNNQMAKLHSQLTDVTTKLAMVQVETDHKDEQVLQLR